MCAGMLYYGMHRTLRTKISEGRVLPVSLVQNRRVFYYSIIRADVGRRAESEMDSRVRRM